MQFVPRQFGGLGRRVTPLSNYNEQGKPYNTMSDIAHTHRTFVGSHGGNGRRMGVSHNIYRSMGLALARLPLATQTSCRVQFSRF